MACTIHTVNVHFFQRQNFSINLPWDHVSCDMFGAVGSTVQMFIGHKQTVGSTVQMFIGHKQTVGSTVQMFIGHKQTDNTNLNIEGENILNEISMIFFKNLIIFHYGFLVKGIATEAIELSFT